jgi:hypothetical protein
VLHSSNLTSLWMISAVELVALLPLFVAGFGCGFYVRSRILEKHRSKYLAKPYISSKETAAPRHPEPGHIQEAPSLRAAVPNRVRSVDASKPAEPIGKTEVRRSLPLDFDPVNINDELRELLKLLPSAGRKKDS